MREDIPVHEKIKIELLSDSGSVSGFFYATIRERDSKVLTLALLSPSHFIAGVKPGQVVRGTFLEEGRLYNFDSKVISIPNSKDTAPPPTGGLRDLRDLRPAAESSALPGPSAVVRITNPKEIVMEELKCYQRIGFTGMEGFVPFRYEIVKRGEMTEITMKERGAAIWLGGDSLVMVNVEPISIRTLLAVHIELPKHPMGISLFGKVSHVAQRGDLYEMEICFEGVREKDRDLILAYILARQADLRRRTKEEEDLD